MGATKAPEAPVAHVAMKAHHIEQMAPMIEVKAYEQLPEDLTELIELEEQAQVQAQEAR